MGAAGRELVWSSARQEDSRGSRSHHKSAESFQLYGGIHPEELRSTGHSKHVMIAGPLLFFSQFVFRFPCGRMPASRFDATPVRV